MKYHSSTPVAPDLYHGKVAHTILDAKALGKALDANYLQAKAEIAEATLFLNERAGRDGRGHADGGLAWDRTLAFQKAE